jgi:TRAP-type C4-dicarboxylate transport system permease large subunit
MRMAHFPGVGGLPSVCGVSCVRLESVIRAVSPYLLAQLGVLFQLVFFPQLVLAPLRFLTR